MEPPSEAIRHELLRSDHGLRAWRRRPLIWLAWVFVVGALLSAIALGDYHQSAQTQEQGEVVRATVLPSWDGGQKVPVRWRNPSTGHLLDIVVPEDLATVRQVGPVDLRVTADHEDEGRRVGSREPAHVVTDSRILIDGSVDGSYWLAILPWMAVGLAAAAPWAWSRRRRVRQSCDALAASSGPVATWIAVPRRGVVLPRRWTLALFEVGAGPGAPSIRRVRVSPKAGEPGPRSVEVHGDVDRWRHSMLVEPGTGQRWVPLGRPFRQHVERPETKATDLDRWWPTGAALVVAGLAMLIIGAVRHQDVIGALNARSEPVTVTIEQPVPPDGATVGVSYRVDDRLHPTRVHFGGPQRPGDQAILRRDPAQPFVLWQDGTDSPPVTGTNTLADLLQMAGSLLVIGGLFLLRRPRTPKESGRPVWATPGSSWAPAPSGSPLAPGWAAPTAPAPHLGDPQHRAWAGPTGPAPYAGGGPQYPPWAWPPPPPPWSPGSSASTLPPPPAPSTARLHDGVGAVEAVGELPSPPTPRHPGAGLPGTLSLPGRPERPEAAGSEDTEPDRGE